MRFRGWVVSGVLVVVSGCAAESGLPSDERAFRDSSASPHGDAGVGGAVEATDEVAMAAVVAPSCSIPDPATLERRAPRTCVPACRWMCTGDLCDVPEQVAIGSAHSCSVRTSGGVECWGANARGQVGDGTSIDRGAAVTIEGLTCVVSIDAGDDHTCALLGDGSVACWGANDAGQLGDGTRTDRARPVRVALDEAVVEIAAGGRTTCAREADGEVVCWGAIGGDALPVTVGVAAAIDVDVGGAHACAVLAGGSVACWGENARGQLGDGTTTSRRGAVSIAGLDGMIAVRTGGAHTCAIDALTHAICWGANDAGQLGDGTTEDRLTPSARHPSVLAAGGDRTCGRVTWGEVACWGEGYGSAPVRVENLGEASFVAIGRGHGCAAHLVGVARCWGDNDRGQLGDGTRAAAAVPVDALPPPWR